MNALRAALREQASACAALGSPFTERLLLLIAERLRPGTPLADRLLGWPGELGPRGASVPLRLAGALHGLRLDGDAGLAAVYPPADPDDDGLWSAVEGALDAHAERIGRWLDGPPQTNEVGRSAALIAAAHWLTARHDLPFRLLEMGASAGLNLRFDCYALETPAGRLGPPEAALTLQPDWTGPLPRGPALRVAERQGVDLAPIHPQADRLRLLAYVWPDQAMRLARTRAALDVGGWPVERGDAAAWLERRLHPAADRLSLVFHTVAWQYFPAGTQARARATIEAAGAAATPDAPVAWLGIEADARQPGAGLALRLWPGDLRIELGRADFHGRWVCWTAGARPPDGAA